MARDAARYCKSVYRVACSMVDGEGPLLEHDRRRDPLCVAVDAARGMTAQEAINALYREPDGDGNAGSTEPQGGDRK